MFLLILAQLWTVWLELLRRKSFLSESRGKRTLSGYNWLDLVQFFTGPGFRNYGFGVLFKMRRGDLNEIG